MSHRHRVSVAVLGVPFDNVTMHETVDLIEKQIEERGFHQVATANLDFLIHAMKDKSLQKILCSCDLVVPDGMPIVWASRLMGTKLKERIAGVDLIPHLAELSCRRGYGIYLLGASEENSDQGCGNAEEAISRSYASLAGIHLPSRQLKRWTTTAYWHAWSAPSPTFSWWRWATPSRSNGLR